MAQAHQALQRHRSHSRYGSDGNDLASTPPLHSTMEPKSCKKSICASTPSTTRRRVAIRMILNLGSWIKTI